jgi:hypothetical protein
LAFGNLEEMVVEACRDLHHSAMEVLMHVGYFVADFVAAVNCVNWHGLKLGEPDW